MPSLGHHALVFLLHALRRRRVYASAQGLRRGIAQVRRTGSAALDLAYVACGRFDAYFEMGLQPWDMAAGVLLVREAGGQITDMRGGDGFLAKGHIVAANLNVGGELRTAIEPFVGGLT